MKLIKIKVLCTLLMVGNLSVSCRKEISENESYKSNVLFDKKMNIGNTANELILHSQNDTTGFIVFLKTKDHIRAMVNVESTFKDKQKAMQDYLTGYLDKKKISRHHMKNALSALNGFVINLNKEDLAKLQSDPEVESIHVNHTFNVDLPIAKEYSKSDEPQRSSIIQNQESLPYGVDIVWTQNQTFNADPNRTAWILDTGCDLDHPDLNVDASRAFSVLPNHFTAEDDNGHGTHVAGTIGAKRNGLGVIGVAPNAKIVPIKAIEASGNTQEAYIVSGINYISSNASAQDIVNMSLGSNVRSTSTVMDQALMRLVANIPGIRVVLAAGNSKDDTQYYPMSRIVHPNVKVVAAVDLDGRFATVFPGTTTKGSNYGANTVAEPGVNIISTWKDGLYSQISGTSMAAPHLTGLLMIPYQYCGCSCEVQPPQPYNTSPFLIAQQQQIAQANCYLLPTLNAATSYPYVGVAPKVQRIQKWVYRP